MGKDPHFNEKKTFKNELFDAQYGYFLLHSSCNVGLLLVF